MSQLFSWGSQSTGVSALASILSKKPQGWSPSEWTAWIALQLTLGAIIRVLSDCLVLLWCISLSLNYSSLLCIAKMLQRLVILLLSSQAVLSKSSSILSAIILWLMFINNSSKCLWDWVGWLLLSNCFSRVQIATDQMWNTKNQPFLLLWDQCFS